jgi:hypothetical protein
MEIKTVYEELLPKKQKVFFAEKGVTASEADHKSNMIKERAEAIEAEFGNTAAYTAIMTFEGDEKVNLDKFVTIKVEELALKQGEMYALSSWLREAVKAKNAMLTFIQGLPVQKFTLEDEKEEVPKFTMEHPPVKYPTNFPPVTEDDVIGTFTVAERAEYLSLNSHASHLGKKLHHVGKITSIRRDLQKGTITDFKELPNGNGMKTYIVKKTPLYNLEEFNKVFFDLQEKHRSFEQRLNYYKARIANEVTDGNAKIKQIYANEARALQLEYAEAIRPYNDAHKQYSADMLEYNTLLEKRRLELIKHISGLKIVIPEKLQHIIDETAAKKEEKK